MVNFLDLESTDATKVVWTLSTKSACLTNFVSEIIPPEDSDNPLSHQIISEKMPEQTSSDIYTAVKLPSPIYIANGNRNLLVVANSPSTTIDFHTRRDHPSMARNQSDANQFYVRTAPLPG